MKKNVYLLILAIFLFASKNGNGQRDIGNGNTVEVFDRNRCYAALGYMIKKGLKIQFGAMNQTTDTWSKNQLQLSIHHKM